jgi:beta-N-acetylhexosaminidase
MRKLALREQVAQMVMPRVNGPELDDPAYRQEIESLVRLGLGGFILFGGDTETTPRHLAGLQALAEVPLFIASDVERGLGQQLEGGTHFPSQRAVASAINRQSKRDVAMLEAMLDAVRKETRAAGINIVFSPVVDVNNNPDNPIICTRAFGDEPEVVEWFGAHYIRGLQKSSRPGRMDLLACAKHFPGHGDTHEDSHSVLPTIQADRHRLNSVELPPFREAVRSGVGTIMVAHLLVPALDATQPTTFSKKIITALLREGMEFNGLIFSDALDMAAVAGQFTPRDIAVRSVLAGIDILLHPHDARVTLDAVTDAVEQGKLTHQRISESLERIINAKTRLGLFEKEQHKPKRPDYEKHHALAAEIGRRAFRIVAGSGKSFLPLKDTAGIACIVLDDDNNRESANAFVKGMQNRFRHVSLLSGTPGAPLPPSLAYDSIKVSDAVVIVILSKISASKGRSGISNALRETVLDTVRSAKASNKITVVISFDSPYILEQFGDADLRIAAYGRMDGIQAAAAEFLTQGPPC